jgi:hypothetical protein
MISSIRYLRDKGATKLAALLMTIRRSPMKTRFRLGQIMVLNALRILTFLSGICPGINKTGRVQITVKF